MTDMNKNIDLTKILKYCPEGTKLYSTVLGYVIFKEISDDALYPIVVIDKDKNIQCFAADGKMVIDYDGECTLFPSKEQRDWSKFTAPWYKKEKFDPKTLKPFDKVLVRDSCVNTWICTFYSHTREYGSTWRYITVDGTHRYCVPYNDDTKHLVGTKEEAPEFYKYWED